MPTDQRICARCKGSIRFDTAFCSICGYLINSKQIRKGKNTLKGLEEQQAHRPREAVSLTLPKDVLDKINEKLSSKILNENELLLRKKVQMEAALAEIENMRIAEESLSIHTPFLPSIEQKFKGKESKKKKSKGKKSTKTEYLSEIEPVTEQYKKYLERLNELKGLRSASTEKLEVPERYETLVQNSPVNNTISLESSSIQQDNKSIDQNTETSQSIDSWFWGSQSITTTPDIINHTSEGERLFSPDHSSKTVDFGENNSIDTSNSTGIFWGSVSSFMNEYDTLSDFKQNNSFEVLPEDLSLLTSFNPVIEESDEEASNDDDHDNDDDEINNLDEKLEENYQFSAIKGNVNIELEEQEEEITFTDKTEENTSSKEEKQFSLEAQEDDALHYPEVVPHITGAIEQLEQEQAEWRAQMDTRGSQQLSTAILSMLLLEEEKPFLELQKQLVWQRSNSSRNLKFGSKESSDLSKNHSNNGFFKEHFEQDQAELRSSQDFSEAEILSAFKSSLQDQEKDIINSELQKQQLLREHSSNEKNQDLVNNNTTELDIEEKEADRRAALEINDTNLLVSSVHSILQHEGDLESSDNQKNYIWSPLNTMSQIPGSDLDSLDSRGGPELGKSVRFNDRISTSEFSFDQREADFRAGMEYDQNKILDESIKFIDSEVDKHVQPWTPESSHSTGTLDMSCTRSVTPNTRCSSSRSIRRVDHKMSKIQKKEEKEAEERAVIEEEQTHLLTKAINTMLSHEENQVFSQYEERRIWTRSAGSTKNGRKKRSVLQKTAALTVRMENVLAKHREKAMDKDLMMMKLLSITMKDFEDNLAEQEIKRRILLEGLEVSTGGQAGIPTVSRIRRLYMESCKEINELLPKLEVDFRIDQKNDLSFLRLANRHLKLSRAVSIHAVNVHKKASEEFKRFKKISEERKAMSVLEISKELSTAAELDREYRDKLRGVHKQENKMIELKKGGSAMGARLEAKLHLADRLKRAAEEKLRNQGELVASLQLKEKQLIHSLREQEFVVIETWRMWEQKHSLLFAQFKIGQARIRNLLITAKY